ncbi:hypothetical protein LUZ60_010060 [Juncus effusus]|nr:hypothetical protein LUZ60_010060 [Juncus effusus]
MGSWSDLPNDILEQVAKKLHHLELLHFGSVCKPWRFLYLENHHRLHLKGPFLLRSSDFYSNSRKYVCVENEKVQGEIFLSESDTCKWICGPSQGWLVIVDSWGQEMYLLNPFMRHKIKLPSPATFPLFLNDQRRPDDACRDSYEYVYKAIISTDPISNPEDCVIMAIVGELHRLSFCKLGDEKWTNVGGSPSLIDDVTFYQSKFYAVSQFDLTISFDGKNPNDHVKSKVVAQGPLARGNLKRYLVPSGGHLLQVWRTIESLFSCYNNCIDDDDDDDDDDYDDNDGDDDDNSNPTQQ